MPRSPISLECASTAAGIPGPHALRRWARAVLAQAPTGAEVCIRIVDRTEMQALNRQYRGQDKPTNVLSFPADLPAGINLPLLGDMAICAPVVADEAVAQGKALPAHWAHMVVHGLLHLLGHDHQHEAEAERMEALETEILRSLDFAPPYE